MTQYDARTALIIVDIQNDFADPAGSLYVPAGETVVGAANAGIERAQNGGALVVYTQDWHPEHTPHFLRDGGIWPVHCVHDTRGAQFHPDLIVEGEIVRKGSGGEDGYSGFTIRDPRSGYQGSTGLEDILRSHGIERVVVIGLATDYCIKETALDAVRKGFAVTVLRDAVRGVNLQPGDDERALRELERAGVSLE